MIIQKKDIDKVSCWACQENYPSGVSTNFFECTVTKIMDPSCKDTWTQSVGVHYCPNCGRKLNIGQLKGEITK